MRVPFLDPPIQSGDTARLMQALHSGWLVPGPWTERFEREFATYLGVEHVVMTSSCTAALHLSLVLAGIGPGDEVLTTPLSWVASCNPILHESARPVFVDVDPATGLIDLDRVTERITASTRAVLPVHLYGQLADLEGLEALAADHGLIVIEDAAHAIEARRDGRAPGHVGRTACFSFQAGKNITCGQGGALVTGDATWAEHARLLRRHGVTGRGVERELTALGYKYELTDFQAALLVGQLQRIEAMHAERQRVFARYREAFRDTPVRSVGEIHNGRHACHLFVALLPADRRDAIREAMGTRGIQTAVHYRPIHLEPFYRERFGHHDGEFPGAEELGRSVLSLPCYPGLTEERQQHVIRTLLTLVEEA